MTTKPHPGQLVLAEYAYRHYAIDVEAGVTLEDLLKPEMWSRNTDGQVRPRDRVRVIAKDGTFDCELIVKAILPGAGVVMQVDASGIPGSAEYDRLRAIEASVHAEDAARRKAELQVLAGGQ